jgi:hypothetical protein
MKGYRVPVRMKLGEMLLNKERISLEKLISLLQLQKQGGKPLGHILVDITS